MKRITRFLLMATVLVAMSSYTNSFYDPALKGAWLLKTGTLEKTISFIDGYCVLSAYDQQNKKFEYTWGGPYKVSGGNIQVEVQFNTQSKDLAGTTFSISFSWKNNQLQLVLGDSQQGWTNIDKGDGPLAGVWRISGRKQGEQISEMPLGVRRTLKILTGNRFQWVAINIETKEFFGTGGGRYTFENGKYTEYIEFFSRDNSRVGASLSFDGKIENGAWHHSGLSSRGEPIYEIWKHINP